MVKNAWVRSPVGEDMLELTLSRKLYTILLCSRRWQPPLSPCAYLNHKSPLDCCDDNIVSYKEEQIHRTNAAIMPATLCRRPCCPAKTGEWKGTRNRTFRAGHRPRTGGWPGIPWNSPGKQLTARVDGAGAGRIDALVRPDNSQRTTPVPPYVA